MLQICLKDFVSKTGTCQLRMAWVPVVKQYLSTYLSLENIYGISVARKKEEYIGFLVALLFWYLL